MKMVSHVQFSDIKTLSPVLCQFNFRVTTNYKLNSPCRNGSYFQRGVYFKEKNFNRK